MRATIRHFLATLAFCLCLAGSVLILQGFDHPEPQQQQQPPMAPVTPTPTPEGPVVSI